MSGLALSPAEELRVIAERLRRLRPSHRDPEHFHLEKDELTRALFRLADRSARQSERKPR